MDQFGHRGIAERRILPVQRLEGFIVQRCVQGPQSIRTLRVAGRCLVIKKCCVVKK
jgi:hypothetical protein